MSEISRRAQAGLVAAGIVAVAPVTLSAAASAATSKKLEATAPRETHSIATTENVVVHIPNPRSGEIRIMVGEKEIIRHDRALVARLVRGIR
jgi:hypothetical protein